MNDRPRRRRFLLVSPVGLAATAGLFAAAYAILHLAGAREHLSLLSGTTDPHGAGGRLLAAIAYFCCYLLTVLVSPVLLGAAGMWASGNWLTRRRARPKRYRG